VHFRLPQQIHADPKLYSIQFPFFSEFVNFVQDNSHNWAERGGFTDSLQAGVLRKIDSRYKIEGVEAYAMPTDVDVTAGLQVSERSERAFWKMSSRDGSREMAADSYIHY